MADRAKQADGSHLPFARQPSRSHAGRTMQDSTYDPRPAPQRLPDDAPNILIILIDDAGPALPEPLGGDVATPTLGRLLSEGIGYNRFHTTAMCSPTREHCPNARAYQPSNASSTRATAHRMNAVVRASERVANHAAAIAIATRAAVTALGTVQRVRAGLAARVFRPVTLNSPGAWVCAHHITHPCVLPRAGARGRGRECRGTHGYAPALGARRRRIACDTRVVVPMVAWDRFRAG